MRAFAAPLMPVVLICVASVGCGGVGTVTPTPLGIGQQALNSPLITLRVTFETGSVDDPDGKHGRLRLLVSREGDDGSLSIQQDVRIFDTSLDAGASGEHALAAGRHAWIQVTEGAVAVSGEALGAGDAAAVSDEARVVLEARERTDLILFDLA